MKKVILFLVGLLVFQTICSQNKERIDWNADLDYLAKELAEKHYDFFTVQSKTDFLSGIDAIKAESKDLDDFHVALKVQQLIARAGDSHTKLHIEQLLDKDQILPVYLLWTSDGLHVMHTTTGNEELLGRQILSINNIPMATIIDSLSTIFTIDNKAIVKSAIPGLLPSMQVLEFFGFANGGQVELTLDQNETYQLKSSAMNGMNVVSFKPDSVAFSMKNQRMFFTDSYYPDEKIYHMLYNVCWSKEIESEFGSKEKAGNLPSFKEFEEKAFNTLENEPVDKIIFDLRYNGGGNSSQGTRFIEKLAEFLKVHPKIKTYVVIGRSTFSSAILNAMDFKRLTNAVFVGEETAGKPNHFGEVRKFQLPNSKLDVSYSTKYFQRTDEDVNTIAPDVVVEMSFSDFVRGIDPVYEWIKNK